MSSRKFMSIVVVITIAAVLLTGCPAPTPQIIEVPREVVVEKEVIRTVVVEKEVAVEKIVKETVEVVKEVAVEVEKEVLVEAQPKTMEFAGFYPADSPWGREFRLVGMRFEDENPGCEFVYSEYPGPEAYKAVKLRMQEGDPVDVGTTGVATSLMQGGSAEWQAGYVYDLKDAMNEPPYGETSGRWYDTFSAGAQNLMLLEGGSIGAVPYMQASIILYYNTDHYEQYDLEPPTTWGQLMANCETLKENDIACITGGARSSLVSYWWDNLLIRLIGQEKMNALYTNSDPEIQWNSVPEALTAAEMLMEMIDKGYAVDGFAAGDKMANQLLYFTGRATHIFVGTWLMSEMADSIPADFNQTVAFFPAVEGYEDVTPYEQATGFMNTFGVYNPGANAREEHSTECAVEWMKLWTSKEIQNQVVNSLSVISAIQGVPGPQNIPGIGELLDSRKLWWPAFQNLGATAPEARTMLFDNVARLTTGEVTPEGFIERMQKDWDDYAARAGS